MSRAVRTRACRLRPLLTAVVAAAVTVPVLALGSPAQAAAGSNQLLPGESLLVGQQLTSPNGRYRLVVQGDGNVVEYAGNRPLWYSDVAAASPQLVMQGDGNLVEYSGGAAVWDSRTGTAGARLVLQDDANLVLYSGNTVIRNFDVVDSRLDVGQRLNAGWFVQSPDRHYRLLQQGDGNLVLYTVNGTAMTARWNAGTSGAGNFAVMQSDGNFVDYSAGGVARYSTGTSGTGSFLLVQDDGNLVLYSGAGKALWSSGTGTAAGGRRLPGQLSLSDAGATFIGGYEGYRERPYNDAGGYCTVGYGHLLHRSACTAADTEDWSQPFALGKLQTDAEVAAAAVRNDLSATPLAQTEFDALVSFTFNVGSGGFFSSSVRTDLDRTAPAYAAVPGHLLLWTSSNGHFVCGLKWRRTSEGALFSHGDYSLQHGTC